MRGNFLRKLRRSRNVLRASGETAVRWWLWLDTIADGWRVLPLLLLFVIAVVVIVGSASVLVFLVVAVAVVVVKSSAEVFSMVLLLFLLFLFRGSLVRNFCVSPDVSFSLVTGHVTEQALPFHPTGPDVVYHVPCFHSPISTPSCSLVLVCHITSSDNPCPEILIQPFSTI